ncbi:MAG: class II fructose-bisphosphatase [Rickettsiales bacterium]|nr:class II fructose-bisphosphatase [Rickettsiales bacterium]
MTELEFNSSMLFESVRVTEKAAIAASAMIGKGNEKKADQLAVNAMRQMLGEMHIDGTVVIGEGERDQAPMLYVGERVGKGGVVVDIALDPLEGTTICATGGPNSMTVLAITKGGGLLNAPDVYMQKIAIGCTSDQLIIDLDDSPKTNLTRLAKVKNCKIEDLTVVILDRERHAEIIHQVREAGARIKLIKDGDIAAVIDTALSNTGVDMYLGIGGAPEGVLAAAALSTTGGQMMGRLIFDDEKQKVRARSMGIKDLNKKYLIQDMARSDDIIFAATGVTHGSLLQGVKALPDGNLLTDSILMSSKYKTIHRIGTEHRNFIK